MTDLIDILRAAERRTEPPTTFDLDQALRRAETRGRRRRLAQVGAGLAAACLVIGIGVAVTGGPAASTIPALPVDRSPDAVPQGDPADYLALLAAPQQLHDQLPPSVAQETSVPASSTRWLGESGDNQYWVALAEADGVCVVAATGPEWAGTACGGGDAILPNRPIVSYYSDMTDETAHVLPDGYVPTAEELAEWTFVTPNLAISDRW